MAYTNSPLVSYTKISPNRNSSRNHTIDTITIHCVVGQVTVERLGEIFAPSSRQASSNYGVGYDGRIGMYCEEKDRSWCTSSRENDNRAITIEVASDTKHPYAVTQAAYNATIQLVADICKRNGIKKLVWSTNKSDRVNHKNGCNMTVHRDYANKSCPGQYLYDRHGEIAAEVNKLLGAETKPEEPVTPSGTVKVGDIVDFLGGAHYSSANASTAAAGNLKPGKAKVTNIYNGKHPYHLVHTDSASAVYGWVDASQIKQLQESNTPVSSSFEVGDVVQFAGGAHYSSANATEAAGSPKAGPAKITAKSEKAKHPYHIIHTDSQSSVYGWVDADKISKNGQTPSTSTCPYPEPTRQLHKGDKGDDVKWVQWYLVKNGYSVSIDGSFGSDTDAKVRKFQGDQGIKVDGWVGNDTKARLKNPQAKKTNPYKEPTSDIKKGAKGEGVKWTQWELVQAGYNIEIDGSFGPATDNAVRDFQKKSGLKVDGWVGKNTRAKLKAN